MSARDSPEYQAIRRNRYELERQLTPHLTTIAEKLRDREMLSETLCENIKETGSKQLVAVVLLAIEVNPVENFVEFTNVLLECGSRNFTYFVQETLNKSAKKVYRKPLHDAIRASTTTGQRYDVFISYDQEESTYATVDRIAATLSQEGLMVFVDRLCLQPGEMKLTVVACAIQACKAFVTVLTKKYIKSNSGLGELYEAEALSKPLYPVVLESNWNERLAAKPVEKIIHKVQYSLLDTPEIITENLPILVKSIISSIETVTFKELKAQTQVSDSQLDTKIEEKDLFSLAVHFNNVETLSVHLKLRPMEQDHAKQITILNDTRTGVHQALKYWSKTNFLTATYRTLVKKVLRMGVKGPAIAEEVCKFCALNGVQDVWDLQRIHGELKLNGNGIKIAVLDTGFFIHHIAFSDKLSRLTGFNFFEKSTGQTFAHKDAFLFPDNHCTAIVYLIFQVAPKANIYIMRIAASSKPSRGYDPGSITTALNYLIEMETEARPAIVLAPFTFPKDDNYYFEEKISILESLGTVFVAATGQSRYNYTQTSLNKVISVGSINKFGNTQDLGCSNVFAPGEDLLVPALPEYYDLSKLTTAEPDLNSRTVLTVNNTPIGKETEIEVSGTSFAAARIAGLLALLFQDADRHIPVAEVRSFSICSLLIEHMKDTNNANMLHPYRFFKTDAMTSVLKGFISNESSDASLMQDKVVLLLKDPISQHCRPGSIAEFSVSSTLTGLEYQWYHNNEPVNKSYIGSRTNCLVIRECLSKHQGQYKCLLSDKTRNLKEESKEASLTLDGQRIKPEFSKLIGKWLEEKSVDFSMYGIRNEKLIDGSSDHTYEELVFLLYKDPSTRSMSENLSKRQYEENAYQEAIENDITVPLLYLKMLAIGPGQIGKSTFLRRLKGQMKWDIDSAPPQNQPQCSTGQAEMELVHIQCSNEVVHLKCGKSSWCTINKELEDEKLIIALTSLLMRQKENIPEDPEPPAGTIVTSDSDSGVHKSPPNLKHVNVKESTSENESSTVMSNVEIEATQEDPESPLSSEISKMFSAYKEFRMECTLNSRSDDELIDTILNIVDVGGQPAFLEILPSLTVGPAMYLVFLKLSHELKTSYAVMYKHKNDTQKRICKDYSYTTEEVIFTALSSIACFGQSIEEVEKYIHEDVDARKTNSLVLLLGTFKDEIGKPPHSKAWLERQEKLLKEQLRETNFYKEGLIEFSDKPEDGDILYQINNKSGGEKEVKEYREIFNNYLTTKFAKYEIPAKWLEFGICLKRLAKQKAVNTLSLTECLAVGKSRQLRMKEESISAALHFLHKYTGLTMYFPDCEKLKHIVVCNPKIVFTSINELVFEIYDSKTGPISRAKCQKLFETGHFSREDFEQMYKSDKLLPLDVFIPLLLHLNIIAPSKSQYFFPAILRSATADSLAYNHKEGYPEPLCISFQTGFLPLGFVCSLTAQLTNEETFELCDRELFKNKVEFVVKKRYIITLVYWPKYCEFRTSLPPKPKYYKELEENCSFFRDTICKAIDTVLDLLTQRSESPTYMLGFKCPSCSSTDFGHEPIAVFKINSNVKEEIKCNKCKVRPDIETSMNPWLAPRIINQTSTSKDGPAFNDEQILSLTATGAKPLQYQWFKDDEEISDNEYFEGANDSKLQIQDSTKQLGKYYCEVSNAFGSKSGLDKPVFLGKKKKCGRQVCTKRVRTESQLCSTKSRKVQKRDEVGQPAVRIQQIPQSKKKKCGRQVGTKRVRTESQPRKVQKRDEVGQPAVRTQQIPQTSCTVPPKQALAWNLL